MYTLALMVNLMQRLLDRMCKGMVEMPGSQMPTEPLCSTTNISTTNVVAAGGLS